MTHREFARYLDISIKSANETEYHLLTSRDLDLISDAAWQKYSTETREVRKMIHAYRVAVLRDSSPAPTDRRADDQPSADGSPPIG